MDKLQQTMDMLYHDFIDIHAKKNKISVTFPESSIDSNQVSPESIQGNSTIPILTETQNDNDTETEIKYSDEYVYKKPWNKLNNIHKIIKVKEFVDNLNTNDIDMKKILKAQLVSLIKIKKINKNTDVNYDVTNGNIIAIPIIQYKDSKYIISS